MEILGLFKIFMKSCPRGTVPTWARFPAPGNTGPNIFHESRGPRIYSQKHGTEPIKSRYREYRTESIKSRYQDVAGPSHSNPVTEMLRDRVNQIPLPRIRDRVNQVPLPRIRDQVSRIPLPRCCGTESQSIPRTDNTGPIIPPDISALMIPPRWHWE